MPLRDAISRFVPGRGRLNARGEIGFNYCTELHGTTLAFTRGPINVGKLATTLLTLLIYHSTISTKADDCPTTKDEICTDRPDVMNSSVVVPAGSLQIENGINSSGRDGSRFVDGTNTRLRAGIANRLEFLWTCQRTLKMSAVSKVLGFPMLRQAVKWQISTIPGKVDLSAVFGVALPTGSASITGRGAQLYLQFP
jgi:hypothetical protein